MMIGSVAETSCALLAFDITIAEEEVCPLTGVELPRILAQRVDADEAGPVRVAAES